jgi:DNA-binding PadR family transcriptional regulator
MTGFKLPSRPRLQYVEAKEDKRKFCIVPFRACLDDNLSRGDLITLMILASYSSPNGYGFVALSTIAKLRGVTVQSISRAIKRLEKKGYVETVRKGYTNMRGALRRIIFEPNLTEVEQVSISNNNQVEVYDMAKHIQKRSKPIKPQEAEHSALSYQEAMLVVSSSLKSEADLLRLEKLVQSGVSRDDLIKAFA